MRVLLAREARLEFEAAVRYYDRQLPGLGAQLREEIREATTIAELALCVSG